MGVIRTFAAVDLGRAIERAVGAVIGDARVALPDVRWVRPENAHLTLKFYGDVDEAKIPALIRALTAAAVAAAPFCLQIAGAGAFPSPKRARVLWLGVEDPSGELVRLAAAVEEASAALGLPREERPYAAHLTIGRAKGQPIRDAERAIEALAGVRCGQADIGELVLYRSDLSPKGSTYTPLARLRLGGPA